MGEYKIDTFHYILRFDNSTRFLWYFKNNEQIVSVQSPNKYGNIKEMNKYTLYYLKSGKL